jgi:hypothetical protein
MGGILRAPWYHACVSDVYSILRRIRAERFPRNRNFDAHRAAASVEARRLHRFLRAVERDLLRAERVSASPHGGGLRVEMSFPSVRLTRRVILGREDVAVLAEDPRLAAKLGLA